MIIIIVIAISIIIIDIIITIIIIITENWGPAAFLAPREASSVHAPGKP